MTRRQPVKTVALVMPIVSLLGYKSAEGYKVKLSEMCWVLVQDIAEVRLSARTQAVSVWTRDGVGHYVAPFRDHDGEAVQACLIDLASHARRTVVKG